MREQLIDVTKVSSLNQIQHELQKNKNLSILGVGGSLKLLLALTCKKPVLYVAPNDSEAINIYETLKKHKGLSVELLQPSPDITFYHKAQNNDRNISRIKTIFNLLNGNTTAVITSVEALFSYFPNKDRFKSAIFSLSVKDIIEIIDLKAKFVNAGYAPADLVTMPGQFSVRGDIVDIFPVNEKFPSRIEFFDNFIESIKLFDPETQRSGEVKKDLTLCPCTNIYLTDDEIKLTIKKLERIKKTANLDPDENVNLEGVTSELIEKLSQNAKNFSMDFIFPLVEDTLSTIFDYLPANTVIFFDECKLIYDNLLNIDKDIKERKKSALNSGLVLNTSTTGYLTKEKILKNITSFNCATYQKLSNANRLFNPDAVISVRYAPVIKYSSNMNEFFSDIINWISDGYKIFIYAGNEENAKKIERNLTNQDLEIQQNPNAKLSDTSSAILPYFLSSGFVLPAEKIVVVGTYDLFPKPKQENRAVVKKTISVPKVGDYVVHAFHGIGRCEGITQLTGSFGTKDFIEVSYYGGDRLYVPIDQMDQLDKYSGGVAPKKLSKIGGADFGAVKEKVKKQIREMAFSLLNLYAEREQKQGVIYPKDDELELEFEQRFKYVETTDQLNAIKDIKRDMESGAVMDRLVCGDVGFGKTEVALRACFKTILYGKQVAFIASTTILARQHYNTCLERMGEFGVRIEILDRFRTNKEIKEVLNRLSNHQVDILCGTHRVLSDDVRFSDLGLVVLDEEQKFGVEHKEKIKLNAKNVNCLSLSATPIPRSLHMALTGIRDISVLETPPTNRVPTETYVTEYSDGLVKSVITRELARNGQVFIVYNRVESIYAFAEHIKSLVKDARIVVGHGQLSGKELEDVIYKFSSKQADVLISTTIIENGIDLPNANSLIVIDSDYLGLSQLYQIRGRVGRSTRQGYAYFTYNPRRVLSEEGSKRLEAISEFTEFGSGFKVAMRDLEIRGSGNVFGAEQHGHIEKVGYELYMKMLNNALAEIKGKPIEVDYDVQIKVNADAYIPESYIKYSDDRMALYKTISTLKTEKEVTELMAETLDRYGEIPIELTNLIKIGYIKNLAKKLFITEILLDNSKIRLTFKDEKSCLNNPKINEAILKFKPNAVLNVSNVATIEIRNLTGTEEDKLEILVKFLSLCNLK